MAQAAVGRDIMGRFYDLIALYGTILSNLEDRVASTGVGNVRNLLDYDESVMRSASSKRCDILRDKQACKVIAALSSGELSSGKGLNQETNLQRASGTHWGLHYDMPLQELNNRFNEIKTELFICLTCLCPNESSVAFDKQKLMRLVELYLDNFSDLELMALDSQLDIYILDMCSNVKFMGLKIMQK
ncbi:uncharacterized protein LOC116133984 [Pistacia vera]|uniref:uncharacterized protein LOC116133984 n=1 Tax=Pistacia vera TaxID=55513 RepID=UPI001262ED8E|nr:uncharacterized protein LOC116133984 [Pistacia vera]